MRRGFILSMARREARAGGVRLAPYIAAMTFGVAALVAINSFRANVDRAVTDQARVILGADLELSSRWPFPPEIEAIIDSLVSEGADLSRVTRFASMALAPRTGATRLVRVTSVEGGYPYYGDIVSDPPEVWERFRESRSTLVDPAVLVQLDARIGDTLAIGESRFTIAGTVTRAPGDIGLRSAIGPRVYIPARHLEETGLLRFGSLADYEAFFRFDDPGHAEAVLDRYRETLRSHQVRDETIAETEEDMGNALGRLARFLGLMGVVALLLGGIGVASGVHVYVADKLDSAAVLRCLGARTDDVTAIYVVQAAALATAAALAGIGIGIGVQAALPAVLRDFLPMDVPFRLEPAALIAGLVIGIGAAILFSLLPFLRLHRTPPLRALRRDFEPIPSRFDVRRLLAYGALAIGVLGITVWQAPDAATGVIFALGLAGAAGILALMASGLIRGARRFFPGGAAYVVRQGLANLFRPRNQTTAVVLGLGFGVFLLSSVYVVESSLLRHLDPGVRADRPNLAAFDIQPDQERAVERVLETYGAPVLQRVPIVSARLSAINGRPVAAILADSAGADGERPERWALRREYRNTYRDTLIGSEELIAGRWPSERTGEISIEEDIAADLGVGLGDRLTWDVQGVPVESEVGSLRRVDWARFEPNFFVVFQPGVLEDAPRTVVILTRLDDADARARLQRDLVMEHPNISVLDLTWLQQTIDSVLDRVALAIRFMAMFSLAAGLATLIAILSGSRAERLREAVLLRTLGATARTVRRIQATEYMALGAAAGVAGTALAAVAGWALTRFLFGLDFHLAPLPLVTFALGTMLLTTLIGMIHSRGILRRPPLAGMRELLD